MTNPKHAYARTPGGSANDFEARKAPRNDLQEAIIRRAQKGDGAAFEHIYRLHSPRVFGLCLRMVGNPTEAEDLTQEAFLLLFRKIQTFRGESALYTWLHRLTRNVVLMQLRKKKHRETPLGGTRKPEEENRGQAEAGAPDLTLTQFVDRLRLKRAVDQLPPTCKKVFVLHEVQGYKHREIAGMMESSVATSKVRLHRARARLRNLLQESLDGVPAGSEAPAQASQS